MSFGREPTKEGSVAPGPDYAEADFVNSALVRNAAESVFRLRELLARDGRAPKPQK
jgi:hypothetical protein